MEKGDQGGEELAKEFIDEDLSSRENVYTTNVIVFVFPPPFDLNL